MRLRLSLRVEFVDCDMTRQCKSLETLWSFAEFSRVVTILEILEKCHEEEY